MSPHGAIAGPHARSVLPRPGFVNDEGYAMIAAPVVGEPGSVSIAPPRGIPMKYRKLGASDLNVSEISLGSWLTYGVGVEKDKAVACVDRAFGLGINFIDTANVYGRGAAETVLGEALAGRPRASYILATKVFGRMGDGNQGL